MRLKEGSCTQFHLQGLQLVRQEVYAVFRVCNDTLCSVCEPEAKQI